MTQIVKFILWAIFTCAGFNVMAVAADEPAVNFEQVSFVFIVGPEGYRGFSRGLTNDHVREAYINTYGLIYKNAKDVYFSLHNDAPPPEAYLYEIYLIGEGGAKKIFLTDRGLDDGISLLELKRGEHDKLVQLIKSKETFDFMGFTDDLKGKKEDVVERATNVFGSKLGVKLIADFSVFKAEYDFYLETKAKEDMRATKVAARTDAQLTQTPLTNPSQKDVANLAAPNKAGSVAVNQLPGDRSASVLTELISKPNQDEPEFAAEPNRNWLVLLIGVGIISILGLIAYKVVNR